MSAINVLLLEDEQQVRELWLTGLTRLGFAVDAADTCAAAIDLIRVKPFDVFVLDFRLGDGDALSVMRFARARGSAVPTIIVSSLATEQDAMDAGGLGGGIIVKKPTDAKALQAAIQRSLAAAAAAPETPGSPLLQAREKILALDSMAPDTPARCRAIVWRLMGHSRLDLSEFSELAELSKTGLRDPCVVAVRLEQIHFSSAIQDPRVRHLLDCIAASREGDSQTLAKACHWSHEGFLGALRTGPGIDARYWIRMARVYRSFRLVLSGDHLAFAAECAGFSDENQLSHVYRDVLRATVTEIRASVYLAI